MSLNVLLNPAIRFILVCVIVASPIMGQEGGTDDKSSEIERLRRELEVLRGDVIAGPNTATDPEVRLEGYKAHREKVESSEFADVAWQFIGPTNISGRVTDIAVPSTPRGQSYTIYVATASGGVWRSDNEGTSWEPIFEDAASTSIGDIAIDPSNSDVLWVGTGEANIFRSSMAGCGVYKSIDRGETWTQVGLNDTHTIARIVVHPKNPDIVYVAASGHEWTNNEERGVYKTEDGGQTWSKVLYIDEKTGAIDLVIDPSDPDTLYASTWQRIRKKWNDPRNEVGYSGSGIYRTIDGGSEWTLLENGLPAAEFRGRIGIDLCLTQPETVYAFVDSYESSEDEPKGTDSYGRPLKATINGAEVYRSDDRGDSWKKVSESDRYMRGLSSTYGWVFGQMRVDPKDPETLYVMGLALNVSKDGGKSFKRLRGMHGDHHALWIDPANPNYLINGNDGGVAISYDGGREWRTFYDNLPVVQFYNVGFDMSEPFRVYGSIQDHGSRRGSVNLSRGRDRIRPVEFENAPGGEASTHVIDPDDPSLVYSAGFYGSISRTNVETNDGSRIAPSVDEESAPLRGQWLAPFILSPHGSSIVYHGMNFLYRSLNRGDTFERISPDLSHNDPRKYGDIPFQTIFSISESPLKFGLIYAGTDDGRLHRTDDGGASWADITSGLAKDRWISRVVASRYDNATVYVTQNGKRHDDFNAYLWRSSDYGVTFTDLSSDVPLGPINVVREDPHVEGVLYLGTDLGVYVSGNFGESWESLPGGLPTTYVHDLDVHPRDDILVIATHGRGMWALDATVIKERIRPDIDTEPEPEAEPESESELEAETADGTESASYDAQSLVGDWSALIMNEEMDDEDREFQFSVTVDDSGKIGGELRSPQGESKISKGSVRADGAVRLVLQTEIGEAVIEGSLDQSSLKGKMILGDGDFFLNFKAKKSAPQGE